MGSKLMLTLVVLGFLSAPCHVQAEGPLPVIQAVKVVRSGDNLGVEISADRKFEYTASKMPQLLRVVIDLPQTEPARPDTVFRYKSILISNIRIEKKTINGVMITRVSVNLTEDADFTTRIDASDNRKMTVVLRKPAHGSTTDKASAIPGNSGSIGQHAVGKPPVPAAPAPEVVLKPAAPGNTQAVTVTGVTFGTDSIEIKSGGNIGEFKAFSLQHPGRLVVDIPGAQSTLRSIAVPANRFGISRGRVGFFEGKLRMVFDAGTKPFPDYEVVKTVTGLRVAFREKR